MKKMILTFGCAIGLALVGAGTAHAGVEQWSDGFEYDGNGAWWFAGIAGIDHGLGFAHTGSNNGWVRATSGWNAINTTVSTYPGAVCTASAWLRSSDTLTGGYMTIRSASSGNRILHEIPLAGPGPYNPQNQNYNNYQFEFTADAYTANFYVGLWGNGTDAWIQVDDVVVSCPTPY